MIKHNEHPEMSTIRFLNYYILMSWHGMSSEEARAKVESSSNEELDKITGAEEIITNLLNLLEQKLQLHNLDDMIHSTHINTNLDAYNWFLEYIGGHVYSRCQEVSYYQIFDVLHAISKELHDIWVRKNVGCFDNNKDNYTRLFLSLPYELIGVTETNKFFVMIAPLFEKFKIPIGYMEEIPYGTFTCLDGLAIMYQRHMKAFLKNNNIHSEDDLKIYFKNIIQNYDALSPDNAPIEKKKEAQDRLNELTSDTFIEKATEQIISTNMDTFKYLNSDI